MKYLILPFLMIASFAYAEPANLKDSQIMNVLVNLNNSEIEAGRYAKQNATSADVKKFADDMIDGHSQANTDVQKLAKDLSMKLESSDDSEKLKKDSSAGLKDLKKLKASALDPKYMDAQVAGHQDALKMLDERLIPNAKSPQLISLLNETKKTVQKHLDMAMKIQSETHKM